MRPDQFHKRMRAICSQPNTYNVLVDSHRQLVSLVATEAPGYADGLKVLMERIHRDARPMAVTGAA